MLPNTLLRFQLASLASLILTAASLNAQTVLSDDFTEAALVGTGGAGGTGFVDSAADWFTVHSNTAGAPVELFATGSPAPISANALRFAGPSTNSVAVGTLAPVTLDTPLEYIELTLNYRFQVVPDGGLSRLGLYFDNGTPLTASSMGSPGAAADDKGYKVQKSAASGANDLSLFAETNTAEVFFAQGTLLDPAVSTGVNPASLEVSTVYTDTLRITLAANGTDLLIDGSFGVVGGSTINATQATVAAADVLTYTFNEIVFSSSSGGGRTLMDNVVVTNVPEPATGVLLTGTLLGMLAFRRPRARR